MKKLILLILVSISLFACDKEENYVSEKVNLIGEHKIHLFAVNDVVQYDTLRLTQHSSYLVLNADSTGVIKFYSEEIFDYDFEWEIIENDKILILNGDLKGAWYVHGDIKHFSRLNDPLKYYISITN
jgi:hypothetical protein